MANEVKKTRKGNELDNYELIAEVMEQMAKLQQTVADLQAEVNALKGAK